MVSEDHSGAIEFNVRMRTCTATLRNKGLRYIQYLARDSSTNTHVMKDFVQFSYLNEHLQVEYR